MPIIFIFCSTEVQSKLKTYPPASTTSVYFWFCSVILFMAKKESQSTRNRQVVSSMYLCFLNHPPCPPNCVLKWIWREQLTEKRTNKKAEVWRKTKNQLRKCHSSILLQILK